MGTNDFIKSLLILIPVICFLIACENEANRKLYLPASSGGHDELLLVMDDEIWKGAQGDTIFKYLGKDYAVLPQSEAALDLQQVSIQNFQSLFTRYRHIMVLSALDANNQTAAYIEKRLGEENVVKALSNPDFNFAVQEDQFAKPQKLIYFFAPDSKQLSEAIKNKHNTIISLVQESENKKYKAVAFFKGKENKLSDDLSNKFDLKLDIPFDYVQSLEDDSFVWLKRDIEEGSSNILISKVDSVRGFQMHPEHAIFWRNYLGQKYISAYAEGSYMISDTLIPYESSSFSHNGLEIVETRGLWKLVNGFMGGPFLNWLIYDPITDQKIMVDAFVFAPGKKKKKELRMLEVVMREIAPGKK